MFLNRSKHDADSFACCVTSTFSHAIIPWYRTAPPAALGWDTSCTEKVIHQTPLLIASVGFYMKYDMLFMPLV